jgi:trehalose-6-phosphate synthase
LENQVLREKVMYLEKGSHEEVDKIKYEFQDMQRKTEKRVNEINEENLNLRE